MKVYEIIVKCCQDCPKCIRKMGYEPYCDLHLWKKNIIEYHRSIPEWCPLPDCDSTTTSPDDSNCDLDCEECVVESELSAEVVRLKAKVAELEQEKAHDKAILTIPEVYYGVVSDAVAEDYEKVKAKVAELENGRQDVLRPKLHDCENALAKCEAECNKLKAAARQIHKNEMEYLGRVEEAEAQRDDALAKLEKVAGNCRRTIAEGVAQHGAAVIEAETIMGIIQPVPPSQDSAPKDQTTAEWARERCEKVEAAHEAAASSTLQFDGKDSAGDEHVYYCSHCDQWSKKADFVSQDTDVPHCLTCGYELKDVQAGEGARCGVCINQVDCALDDGGFAATTCDHFEATTGQAGKEEKMVRHIAKEDYWVCKRYPWGCDLKHTSKESAENCACGDGPMRWDASDTPQAEEGGA